jgi:hypothetical protein
MPRRSRVARGLVAGVLTAAGLAGCGGQQTVVKTVTVSSPTTSAHVVQKSAAAASRRPTSVRPSAKKSKPSGSAAARPVFVRCDANIQAKVPRTSCGFAQNAFYEYWTSGEASSITVYSPATDSAYLTECTAGEGWIVCTTSDGGAVKFPQSSIDSYSQSQADAYAAAHTTSADPSFASTDSSAPSGSADSSPAPDSTGAGAGPSFCDTHDCIPNYPNGNGSTVQCADGSYSQSGGVQGACSRHGGVG